MIKNIPFEITENDTLQTLFTKTGAYSLEQHENLESIILDKEYEIDFNNGIISFGNDLKFNFKILGTLSAESEKWHWAYDDEDVGFSKDLLTDAFKIKDFGEEFNISHFKRSLFDASIREAHILAMTSSVLLGANSYYVADFDEIYFFLTIYSDEIKGENSAKRFIMTYDTFQKAYNTEISPMMALEGYANLKGYEYKESLYDENDKFSVVKINDSRIIVGFTERGNVSHIQTFIE
ncbi:MAG: hypothetical protein LBM96_11980 [Methanobrevibacter sp.]|jgi:hypothetical protein|nr:hypothetical protein [Candidatus Methanoflexus mossambicus]